MAELREVWKALFGRELEDGWSSDQSGRKVFRISVNVLDRARDIEADEEYEKELQEMLRFVDTCQECREKWRCGAGSDDLDARCSELLREGIGDGIKK